MAISVFTYRTLGQAESSSVVTKGALRTEGDTELSGVVSIGGRGTCQHTDRLDVVCVSVLNASAVFNTPFNI